MKTTIEMLCLANSVKHNARCLAGVRLDTGGWIRPVSDEDGSGLLPEQYMTASGHVPTPLDTVKFEVRKQHPKYHQPENWIVSGKTWELVETEVDNSQLLALNSAVQREGDVISDEQDFIAKHELADIAVPNSLTVLHPTDVKFWIKEQDDGPKPRADFSFDGVEYSMPITEPAWRERAAAGDDASLPSPDDIADSEKLLFTISLGENYEGNCYKLIAAVFTVDEDELLDV